MLVDVSNLPKAGAMPITLSEVIIVPPEYALTDIEVSVDFEGQIINDGDFYLLEGTSESHIKAECDKCLHPIKLLIKYNINEKFNSSEDHLDDDFWFFEGDSIDLTPALETNLFVNIPIRFLCSEDCKGLCIKCGQNLNQQECNCNRDIVDSPFDILRSLF